MRQHYITLREGHVGKPWIRAFHDTWLVSSFMGRIQPHDVGKRVYLVNGDLQVENDEQRAARLAKGDE